MKTVKQGLIEDIQARVESRVIEQSNADLLIKLIGNAESIQEAMSIAELGTMYKRTGYYFDVRLEKQTQKIKYLNRNNDLSIGNAKGKGNKLIIGDNFDALNNLLITHRNKIDVIYIDPPYGKDSMGNFADTNYENGLTRDNLLSMLQPRLILAKELLTDEGVIFCSIDDRNQAHVKLLFDEVFGEQNCLGTMIQMKGNTQNDSKEIQRNHEYILGYAKTYNPLLLTYTSTVEKQLYLSEHRNKETNLVDVSKLNHYIEGTENGATGNSNRLVDRKSLGYTIYYLEIEQFDREIDNHIIDKIEKGYNGVYNKLDLSTDRKCLRHAIAVKDYNENDVCSTSDLQLYDDVRELIDLGYIPIRPPIRTGGVLGRWTWGLDTFNKYWNNGEVAIKNRKNIIHKDFVNVSNDNTVVKNGKTYFMKSSLLPLKSIIDIPNTKGTELLAGKNGILPGCGFANPKSIELIKYLITSYNKKNATVLDFFAGSGTTGQAVLDLNKEDGGNRTFILCTNNEITQTNPKGIAYDVTAKRMKRVMTGCCYDGSKDFKWIDNNEPYGGSMDVFEIEEINNFITEGKPTPFDVIDEQNYGLDKFDNIMSKVDWVCENFKSTCKKIEKPSVFADCEGEA